jgi:hypothetical protein
LKTFNHALHSTHSDSNIIPYNLAQTIVNASHCVGFTFPGMIEEPGSFSMINSPIPERGPEANIRMSFAILFNETANCFNAPCDSTIAS